MFNFGIFLLLLGAVLVYATVPIIKIFNITTTKGILVVKLSGLALAVIGAIIMFFAQFPQRLEFLRLI
ncbi:hypothetical protein [Alkaliphilus serpentinus]|uniref:Uncharacterized protein n=1 Tax=Alkaliphilus serpentinus TaxID=1482731 RepID=A0A833HNV2_9FIRM|nr:hypothetical protein [Alkaliphilus serpentinus]KAB3529875.1 hypothetical protein F8153_08735 [Alkaliphilus serpentinus]